MTLAGDRLRIAEEQARGSAVRQRGQPDRCLHSFLTLRIASAERVRTQPGSTEFTSTFVPWSSLAKIRVSAFMQALNRKSRTLGH